MEKLETIDPFTLALWERRAVTVIDGTALEPTGWDVRIAVSSSARNGLVGIGGAVDIRRLARDGPGDENLSFSIILGKRDKQNAYSGELAAMAKALNILPRLEFCKIALATRNKATILILGKPRQQSGQMHISNIYKSIRALKRDGNTITIAWLPASEGCELMTLAKRNAKIAIRPNATPQMQLLRIRSTTRNLAQKYGIVKKLPDNVGRYSKTIDTALLGKHTRLLYDRLSRKEASVLI
jgi:ribonuclease HI